MESSNKANNSEGVIFNSKLFWTLVSISITACLAGLIYCCISFGVTTKRFSDEYIETLHQIKSISTEGTSAGISEDNPSDTSTNSLLDVSSDDSSAELSPKIAVTESLITHMENMIAIQKSGMTNDLMSFIYGILSTVLVGMCATFVVKSRTNADEAKKTADEAKNQATIAANMAKETQKAIEEAQNAARNAKELRYQVRLIIITGRIVSAQYALLEQKSILANRAIAQIRDEVNKLFSDEEYKQIMGESNYFSTEVGILYDELVGLIESIKSFSDTCENKYKNEELETMKSAAENYKIWAESAIKSIDACRIPRKYIPGKRKQS